MERIFAILTASLTLAAAGCAAQAPSTTTPPGLVASEMHTPGGTGPVSYPTSIYDPSLLNDPSLIEDQPHNRGNKGPNPGPMLDMGRARH